MGRAHPKEIYTLPSWLESILNFLNSNNGIITAFATVLLAGITWRYVRLMKTYVQLTQENVRLTQEMLENSYKPEVVVRLLREGVRTVQTAPMESTDKPMIILSVKNVGPGIARKIKFEGNFSFQPYKDDPPLKSINFLTNGIDRLAPGDEKKSHGTFTGDPSGDPNQLQVMIIGTWEDLKGKKHCEDFYLNFADPDLPQGNK